MYQNRQITFKNTANYIFWAPLKKQNMLLIHFESLLRIFCVDLHKINCFALLNPFTMLRFKLDVEVFNLKRMFTNQDISESALCPTILYCF